MTRSQKITRPHRRRARSGAYRESASAELLQAAAIGTILVGALMLSGGSPISPYWWRHLQKHGNNRKEHKRQLRLRKALRRLELRQLVRITTEGEGLQLHLTPEGKNLYRSIALRATKFKQPKHWDGKWRIVLFDIPEKQRKIRQAIQQTLRNAGCYPLQKSVLVTPVPCKREVEAIAALFESPNTLLYCETMSLGKAEPEIRKFFGMR